MHVAGATHRVAGVGLEHEIRSRFSRARQHETLLAILSEVPSRIGLVNLSFNESCGARQAPALETTVGEVDVRRERRVEHVRVGVHGDDVRSAVGLPDLDAVFHVSTRPRAEVAGSRTVK